MRSGNGRHRRPRQAPALIVAAGVTGSAIAIPLFAASGASAADGSTWDRVAECESGGMWSADLGNGHYGGLQLTQETWDAFGGGEYAARPDLASRSQQIAIAEKVLSADGVKAWSSCAPVSGLVEALLPDVDLGGDSDHTKGSKGKSGAGPSDGPSATPGGESSPSAGASARPGEPVPSGPSDVPTPGASASAEGTDGTEGTPGPDGIESALPGGLGGTTVGGSDSATGKHRGPAAQEDAVPDVSGEGYEYGRHASRGDGLSRSTDVLPEASDAPGAADTDRPAERNWLIADGLKVPGGWL
ncbi:transglycosylase family protein [Streptomyces odonnellii]|uniref:transglycosylase family protein n=1 Tax=Streptomyces odonnellii TaxID=1417980 RepID=UPI00069659C5|nr:transglycosylase family protein [Streptomyces odonnellii]